MYFSIIKKLRTFILQIIPLESVCCTDYEDISFYEYWYNILRNVAKFCLKLDSHVPENFSQIKNFPCLVKKNTIICLFGV